MQEISQPRPQTKRHALSKALMLAVVASLLFMFLLRRFELSQVFHPTRDFAVTASEMPFKTEDVWMETEDSVRIHAWWMPSQSRQDPSIILFCHGNGGNISHRTMTYELLLQCGYSVLAFDYRGYGKSEGYPSETGTYLDAEAAYLECIRRVGHPEKIVFMGESLGGGIASHLASKHRPAGLILQSTFTSLPDLGSELFPWLPVKKLASIQYNTLTRLRELSCPTLILHGREDSLIGFHHAQENYHAAAGPKWLVELEGDHNDQPHSNPHAFKEAIQAFRDSLEKTSQP